MTVHNHGPREGRGLNCPERLVDGELLGACLRVDLSKYREPLGEWFRDFHTNGSDYPLDVWRADADALLASPVLAQIVADAKAEERERVAKAIEAMPCQHPGPCSIVGNDTCLQPEDARMLRGAAVHAARTATEVTA